MLTVGSSTILARIIAALDLAEIAISANGDPSRFADTVGMRRVDFPPAAWDPFLNLNTPADLAMARSLEAGSPGA